MGCEFHQTRASDRTDQAVDGHRTQVFYHGAKFQAQSTVCREKYFLGNLCFHLSVAQHEVRQDGKHGTTPGTLNAPDGQSVYPSTDIVGVAGEPLGWAVTFMLQLKPDGHDESNDELDEGRSILA